MMGAANLAYRKAVGGTRDKTLTNPNAPAWMKVFAEGLPDDDTEASSVTLKESARHHKIRVFKNSTIGYNRFAFKVYEYATSRVWFESFIMANIILVGLATGLDLENAGRDAWTVEFVNVVGLFTLVVFSVECILKIIAEGTEPLRYFTDHENGYFNMFDFVIVIASLAFVDSSNGGALSALRMLRLVRLLTFVKGAPVLRVIVAGLFQGLQSVVYIVILLLLVIYIFAILGTLLFGLNDPAHFGNVAISMLSLFKVSTLASWTSIAYISWFGCENYIGSPYASGPHPSSIHTSFGTFQGFKCDSEDTSQPIVTGIFFACYILCTAWVIMTLFIGVISMGMFAAFLDMKVTQAAETAIVTKARNLEMELPEKSEPHLKNLIDLVFDRNLFVNTDKETKWAQRYEKMTNKAKEIRDSSAFTTMIALTIGVVGIKISLDTDQSLACLRLESRTEDRIWDSSNEKLHDRVGGCEKLDAQRGVNFAVDMVAQAIFTLELIVKVLAEGSKPHRYFLDAEEGSWNCLDCIIVLVGFIELTPGSALFKAFPVVLLRLLRLIRVFRLAKTLPRLRAIVEALISGFSAVGWICVLIVTFNYIAACMCMLLFQENDPFHFGSLGRAMFSVQRISTLDSWDQILYIALYGCDEYPGGYDFTLRKIKCNNPKASGWAGVAVIIIIVLLGAYILPTVLVGIISIKFDEASQYGDTAKLVKERTDAVIKQVQGEVTGFFTEGRMEILKSLFNAMDCNGNQSLEIVDITPYFHYVFDAYFGVLMRASTDKGAIEDKRIFQDRSEALYQIMDTTKSGNVSFDEFVRFTSIITIMMNKCKSDGVYAQQLFGPAYKNVHDPSWTNASWNRAMVNVDYEATEQAWDAILLALTGKEDSKTAGVKSARTSLDSEEIVRQLFADFNSAGGTLLDVEEFTVGLKSLGVHLTERQLMSIITYIDTDNTSTISFEELNSAVVRVRQLREEKMIENARKEAVNMISQANAKDERRKFSQSTATSAATSRQASPNRAAARPDAKLSSHGSLNTTALTSASQPATISELMDDVGTELQQRIEALGYNSVEDMLSFLETEKRSSWDPSVSATAKSSTTSSSPTSKQTPRTMRTPSRSSKKRAPGDIGTPKGVVSKNSGIV